MAISSAEELTDQEVDKGPKDQPTKATALPVELEVSRSEAGRVLAFAADTIDCHRKIRVVVPRKVVDFQFV